MRGFWSGHVYAVLWGRDAVLCDYEGYEAWIPYDVICDDSDIYKNCCEDEGELVIPWSKAWELGWG